MRESTAWIDLGDQTALDASRVERLEVIPPVPESYLGGRYPGFLEQQMWNVTVLDGRTYVVSTVGLYWAEAEARAHARRIISIMVEAA
jgi:hypothetical protein